MPDASFCRASSWRLATRVRMRHSRTSRPVATPTATTATSAVRSSAMPRRERSPSHGKRRRARTASCAAFCVAPARARRRAGPRRWRAAVRALVAVAVAVDAVGRAPFSPRIAVGASEESRGNDGCGPRGSGSNGRTGRCRCRTGSGASGAVPACSSTCRCRRWRVCSSSPSSVSNVGAKPRGKPSRDALGELQILGLEDDRRLRRVRRRIEALAGQLLERRAHRRLARAHHLRRRHRRVIVGRRPSSDGKSPSKPPPTSCR